MAISFFISSQKEATNSFVIQSKAEYRYVPEMRFLTYVRNDKTTLLISCAHLSATRQ